MKSAALTLLACLFAVGTKLSLAADSGGPGIFEPNLLQLIADPDRYNGRQVRVTGYCSFEFEGTGIYLYREDYLHRLSNRLWLDIPPESDREPQYCIVEGTFDSKQKGHLGVSIGTITSIGRLQAWPGR